MKPFEPSPSQSLTNPMTTSGDIIYGDTGGTPARLAKGTDGQFLSQASGIPSWGTPVAAGLVAIFGGVSAPSGWLMCDGSAVSRTTYSSLFSAITIQQTGTVTNSSVNITGLSDTSNMKVGMPLSGSGIQAGTKIASIVSSTAITMDTIASGFTGSTTITVAPHGVGDGSTTFNVPDTRGVFVRGAGSQTISTITYSGQVGTKQGDQFQGHYHDAKPGGGNVYAGTDGAGTGATISGPSQQVIVTQTGAPKTDGTNGTPRTGAETRPANISMNYIIKT